MFFIDEMKSLINEADFDLVIVYGAQNSYLYLRCSKEENTKKKMIVPIR